LSVIDFDASRFQSFLKSMELLDQDAFAENDLLYQKEHRKS
ncbi:20858_t:CDS:1, partial [Gigaspora rosea]